MYIIPIYNITVLPDAITYLHAQAFKSSTGQAAAQGDKVILLPTKTEKSESFAPFWVVFITKFRDNFVV